MKKNHIGKQKEQNPNDRYVKSPQVAQVSTVPSTMKYLNQRVLWCVTTAALLLFTACTPPPAEAPTAPTRAPAPTFTPTTAGAAPQPTVAPQPAAEQPVVEQPAVEQAAVEQPATQAEQPVAAVEPTAEPVQEIVEAPTHTPEPSTAQVIVNTQLLNVRGGPGTNYETVAIVDQGERFDVTGKNNAGDWWEIKYNGQRAWVFNELVITDGTENVAVAALIPVPPPPTQAPVIVVPPTQPPPPAPAAQPPLNATQIAYYTAVAQGPIQPPAPPAQTPVPDQPSEPAPPPEPSFPFQLLENVETCEPNAGITYFEGFVRYKSNEPRNAVCVHIGFFGPRTTKCSGCDGVGAGKWGFSPFGGPAPEGTSVEIFVVSCPSDLPAGGQNSGFSDLTPLSKKWTHTINSSEQCTGITFVGDE